MTGADAPVILMFYMLYFILNLINYFYSIVYIMRGGKMLFISIDDFYEKVGLCKALTRQEEIECAKQMKNGNAAAREKLIQSYMPMVAGYIRHAKPHMQNLGLVLYCQQALEKAVDSFNFLQDSEPFSHRLSWYLRQAFAKYMVK